MDTLLKDDKGNFSVMRVAVLLVVFFVMLNWTIANIKAPAGTMVPLNWEEFALALGAIIAKFGQKFVEKS